MEHFIITQDDYEIHGTKKCVNIQNKYASITIDWIYQAIYFVSNKNEKFTISIGNKTRINQIHLLKDGDIPILKSLLFCASNNINSISNNPNDDSLTLFFLIDLFV